MSVNDTNFCRQSASTQLVPKRYTRIWQVQTVVQWQDEIYKLSRRFHEARLKIIYDNKMMCNILSTKKKFDEESVLIDLYRRPSSCAQTALIQSLSDTQVMIRHISCDYEIQRILPRILLYGVWYWRLIVDMSRTTLVSRPSRRRRQSFQDSTIMCPT